MKKQPTPEYTWTPDQLELGQTAWDALEKLLSENPDTLSKLYIMLLELGPEEVINKMVLPIDMTDEARVVYKLAIRFKWYDMNNPDLPDRSRPGVTELFALPKPNTKPW